MQVVALLVVERKDIEALSTISWACF